MLRRIFEMKEMKRRVVGENYTMRRFITCTSPSIIRMVRSRRIRGAGHVAQI
jgi:hypothetical protein